MGHHPTTTTAYGDAKGDTTVTRQSLLIRMRFLRLRLSRVITHRRWRRRRAIPHAKLVVKPYVTSFVEQRWDRAIAIHVGGANGGNGSATMVPCLRTRMRIRICTSVRGEHSGWRRDGGWWGGRVSGWIRHIVTTCPASPYCRIFYTTGRTGTEKSSSLPFPLPIIIAICNSNTA